MNQDSKIECYRKAYQELKEISRVNDLSYPEEKKNLEFTCKIDDIDIEYNLRLALDFLTIRASKQYPGESDSRLTEIGQLLTDGQTCKFTAYNETIIFQLSLPLVGIADEDAKRFVNDETRKFFNFILSLSSETASNSNGCISEETNTISSESNTIAESTENNIGGNPRVFQAPNAESSVTIPKMETAAGVMGKNEDHADQEERMMQLEWIVEKKKENAKRELELDKREQALSEKEEEFESRVSNFNDHADEIQSKITELSNLEDSLKVQRAEINEERMKLKEQDDQIVERAKHLKTIDTTVSEREKLVIEKEAALSSMDNELRERESILDKHQEELERMLAEIASQEMSTAECTKALTATKEELDTMKNLFENSRQEWNEKEKKLLDQNQILQEDLKSLQQSSKDKENAFQGEISSLQNSVSEYNAVIKEHERICAEKTQELDKLFAEKEELLRQLSSTTNNAEESVKNYQIQITSLRSELETYRRHGADFGTPDEVLNDFADTRKENRRLRHEIEDMRMEAEINEKALLDQIQLLQNAQAEKDKEAQEKQAANTPEALANTLVAELQTSGLMFNINREDGYILECKRDGCDIRIDVEKKILFIKKQVMKAARYQEQIKNWNQEDITEAYYFNRKEIMCKKVMADVTLDVNKVLRRFILLK